MNQRRETSNRRQFLGCSAIAALTASYGAARCAAAEKAAAPNAAAAAATIAVITGGHAFDVPNFHKMFRALPGVEAVIQHIDDFAASPVKVRDSYDAVLFYFMMMPTPSNEGLAWYAGRPKEAIEHLGATEQGIFVLHHALLAYAQWPVWSEIVGISNRKFGYHMNQKVHVNIVNDQHPITKGLAPWDMVDETYTMANAGQGSEILMTVDHPKSMKTVGWTRQHKKSRVFCLSLGHDNAAYADKGFSEVVRRGIQWCARRG